MAGASANLFVNPTARTRRERFRRARRDPEMTVIEGFHALKHAVRFGAELLEVVCCDLDGCLQLAAALAPELEPIIRAAHAIDAAQFAALAPLPHPTGIMALARQRPADPAAMLAAGETAPVVLLEHVVHLGNLGAVVRVAAAAGAGGVLSLGRHDPWRPEAVRAAAGLQYALPVARIDRLPELGVPLVALTPRGEPLRARRMPSPCLLAFGNERRGLSEQLLDRAQLRLSIPMQAGVSSLNLATAVAVALYAGCPR